MTAALLSGSLSRAQENPRTKLLVSPKSITESFSFFHPDCPGKAVQKTSISYPQGLGNDRVDSELKSIVEGWLETAKSSAEDLVAYDGDPCARDHEYFNEISFEIHKPSDSYAGILFTDLGYNGGVHGYRLYQALNFNLSTGRFVELTDLFPDPQKSLVEFFNLVYTDVCSPETKHKELPHFYGGVPCSTDGTAPLPPREFTAKVDSLETLGNMVLTTEGVTVNIGPHSAWSWADGPYVLRIPKEKVVKIGGDPVFWNGETKQSASLPGK